MCAAAFWHALSTEGGLAGKSANMIILAALIFGAVIGWTRARRLQGNRADRLQYAIAHALAFTVLGVIITVIISRFA